MMVMVAFALGTASLMLGSAMASLAVAGLIVVAFAAACLVSGALLPLSSLLAVYLGFNAGLAAVFLGALAGGLIRRA